ncbi:MAG: DUF3299 domain-containing protein [Cyanobacteria bacterium P01_B01_bin.77]
MPYQIAKLKIKVDPLFSLAFLRRWGRYFRVFIVSFCLVWCVASSTLAQTALTWENLQPSATSLQNPYAHLSIDQTRDLATLAGLKTWVEENQPSPASLESREVLRLNQKLQAQDLDVEALLSQIDQAQAYWQQKSQSINSQWIGKTVELSGYILPLTWNQAEKVTDFLLVPYVGACIHVPSPPPNQIVYIQPEQALATPGMFTPVVVEGQLRSQPTIYEVFQVDGSRPIDVSYALTLNHLTLAETPSAGQPSLPLGPSSGPWWQRLQARASATLTQAVGNVHRQRSPITFLWGLLISFSYGVLHTLGPGHGKAVIMTYFVGQGGSLRRGLTMGIQIAVFHVLSAIGIVVLTTLVLRQSTPDNYRLVQLVSYGAIAIIGGWMLWKAIPRRHKVEPVGLGAKAADLVLYPDLTKQVSADTALAVDCSCITCVEPKRIGDWLSLAIGSVPCSGALLILLYGSANNLLVPSIAMVIAISVGMAITLAWIGTLALMGRNYAERKVHLNKRRYRRLHQWLRFVGAGCVLLLGLGLFGVTLVSGS